jgi:hypothetical protein
MDQKSLTHLCQRDGQTSNTATTIANRFSRYVTIFLDPLQNLLDSLVVTSADIQLNRVHVIAFGVNLIPSVETFRVEIFTDFGLVVHTRRQG